MFIKCNTKKQGDIGLGDAIAYFTSIGLTPLLPISDSLDYDMVVEIDAELRRIQVKTTRYKKEKTYFLSLASTGGNSKKNFIHRKGQDIAFDLLYVLTEEGNRYLIPRDKVNGSVTLGKKFEVFLLRSPSGR